MSAPVMTAPQGARLSSGRMTAAISLMSAFPFLGLGIGGVIAGLIVGHHASFRIVFRGLAAGLTLLAAVFAAVYLVTYWSGFRGGGRAMVARPHFEEAVPAAVSGIGIPGTATGAEAS